MHNRWYQEALIYCLDVETYADSGGDGIGDFVGLTSKLDYIAGLGFTCIWLLPFFPTPNRDNGYDISDYYSVDPRLGSLGDFVEFARQAHDRGIRIVIDLVINHTSSEHPWFQQARADPESPYRDYYLWSKDKPTDANQGMIFPGKQERVWTYDRVAKEYYFHRFFPHQPDLNTINPRVRDEIAKIIGFWLELGVDGFRIDAAPFVIERLDVDVADIVDPYALITDIHHLLAWRRGDAMMLAEANVDPDQLTHYFGNSDRMHMLFNFILNQHMYLALARKTAEPLVRALYMVPKKPPLCQWAVFVRNHDELALERLSPYEREEISRTFGFTEEMWLYDRGVPRRLPPILDGDLRRIKQVYSLLFTLPGTPVIWYGEEIGMGDNLSLEGRNPVRTPMQWSDGPNGGYSNAPVDKLIRPLISAGDYSYKQVNVAAQQRDPNSLLNAFEMMLRVRRGLPEIGRGTSQLLATNQAAVFAIRYDLAERRMVAVHNLSDTALSVELDLGSDVSRVTHLLDGNHIAHPKDRTYLLDMQPYDSCWLRLERD
ncbi:MAG: trehalose synthase [Oscillochloris sp.]|nr:trehalose synthase [Oscillochloris sp.]